MTSVSGSPGPPSCVALSYLGSSFTQLLFHVEPRRARQRPEGRRAPGWPGSGLEVHTQFCLSEASSAELRDATPSQACETLLRPSTGKGPPHGFWAQN